jgi:hypothetical protein
MRGLLGRRFNDSQGTVPTCHELERLMPAIESGGYVPPVDHQTPPGVSLESYRTYLGLFAEYAKRAAAG